MEKEKTNPVQKKKVEELHKEIRQWKSQMQFIDNESLFISHLLGSNIFKPNILNLFERLQNFKNGLEKVRDAEDGLRIEISRHERNLGDILESSDKINNVDYYLKHNQLQHKVAAYFEDFQTLKSDIFNYVGSVLKKHRP